MRHRSPYEVERYRRMNDIADAVQYQGLIASSTEPGGEDDVHG